jgi:hypothetical protein
LVAYPKLDDEAIRHSMPLLATQLTGPVRAKPEMSISCCMIVAEWRTGSQA